MNRIESRRSTSSDTALFEDVDDQASGEIDARPRDDDDDDDARRYFEGPEKTLEVFFRRSGCDNDENAHVNTIGRTGMRSLPRSDLERVCDRARCTILSAISNDHLDAYVLSESSLFVYPQVVVLKTCGTTTLLRCVATLIGLGRKVGLEVDWVGYSRKNFNFPWDQRFPHESFHQELEYLESHRSLTERLNGNGYTLGPVTGDHWFVFVADKTQRFATTQDTDRVLNIMMFDIHPDVARKFYFDAYENNDNRNDDENDDDVARRVGRAQTVAAGVDALCPGHRTDPRAFRPCGYSANAILFGSYATIHVTPEHRSSYASFETNQRSASYTPLVRNVLRTFRPRRVVVTLMADEDGLESLKENPFRGSGAEAVFTVSTTVGDGGERRDASYRRCDVTSIQVEDDCCLMMGNWVLQEDDGNGVVAERRERGNSVI